MANHNVKMALRGAYSFHIRDHHQHFVCWYSSWTTASYPSLAKNFPSFVFHVHISLSLSSIKRMKFFSSWFMYLLHYAASFSSSHNSCSVFQTIPLWSFVRELASANNLTPMSTSWVIKWSISMKLTPDLAHGSRPIWILLPLPFFHAT